MIPLLLWMLLVTDPSAQEPPSDLETFLAECDSLSLRGDFVESERRLRQAYESTAATQGPSSREAARVGVRLIRIVRNLERWSEPGSLELVEQIVATFEGMDPPDPRGHANALLELGAYHNLLGDHFEAEKILARAIELYGDDESNPQLAGEIHSYYTAVLIERSKLDLAEQHARRALELRTAALGEAHVHLAFDYYHLGRIENARGNYAAAEANYQKCLEIREAALGSDSSQVALTLQSLGLVRYMMGRYGQAEENFHRGREIADGLDEPGLLLRAWGDANLGKLYQEQGRYDRARVAYREALEVRMEILGRTHPWTLQSRFQLAETLAEFGEQERALTEAESALSDLIESNGLDHLSVAEASTILAGIEEHGRDLEAAIASHGRALEIFAGQLGPNAKPTLSTRLSLARLALEMGDLERADSHIRTVSSIVGAGGVNWPRDYLLYEEILALVDIARADPEGVAELERVEARTASIRGEFHDDTRRVRTELALACGRAGRHADALRWACRASDSGAQLFGLIAPGLPEAWALRYQADRFSIRGLELALLRQMSDPDPDAIADVWNCRAQGRSLVLESLLYRRAAVARGEGESSALWQQLVRSRKRMAEQTLLYLREPESEAHKGALQEALLDREVAEDALSAAIGRGVRLSITEPVELREIVARLEPGTALLSVERHEEWNFERSQRLDDERYTALVFADGKWYAIDLGPADRIDSLVERWHREAAEGELDLTRSPRSSWLAYESVARELFDAFLDPLGEPLGGMRRVLWIPATTLQKLDPGVLIAPDGRFVLEHRLEFVRLSSERDLQHPSSAVGDGGLLAVGGIPYGGAVMAREECAPPSPAALPPLKYSGRELEEIARVWSRAQVDRLTGPNATKQALRKAMRGRESVHLSVHAYFVASECLSDSTFTPLQTNPLLRAGLVLSDIEGDGHLSADEISTLDLRGLRRVVLSACNTGRGVERMNELALGLPRSFLEAGAKEVVMSLWEVPDRATSELMVEFYRQDGDLGAAERAVLAARRERGDAVHPFHWAAFEVLTRGN